MSKKNYVVTPLSSKEQCSKARGNFSSPQVNDSLLQKEWNRGNQDGGVVEIEGGGGSKSNLLRKMVFLHHHYQPRRRNDLTASIETERYGFFRNCALASTFIASAYIHKMEKQN
jgi:hypothetical protein